MELQEKEIQLAVNAMPVIKQDTTVEEPNIPVMNEGKFYLMEHKIKPFTSVDDKEAIEIFKEVEFKSESISGKFNPSLKEIFASVQDDNDVLTKAIAFSVNKNSEKLDSSKKYKTAKVSFYKLKD